MVTVIPAKLKKAMENTIRERSPQRVPELDIWVKASEERESDRHFIQTRPKPAYGQQGLDWIVGPGYSFVVFSTNKTMETHQKP